MVVRVDTTNLTKGLDFSVIVHTDVEPTVSLYGFNTSTHEVEALDFNPLQEGAFWKFSSKAPYFNGFVLATINSKSILAKKVGYPLPHFVIGHKAGYTVPFEVFDLSGVKTKEGNLTKIIDGFYYTQLDYDMCVVKTLNKRFIVKNDTGKLAYDVSLGEATLGDVTLPEYDLGSTLGEATLGDIQLSEIQTDAILADATITGY
jgi:hypothetical protein